MRLLLDEMYGPSLAEALRAVGIEASTVVELRLAGASDSEVFAAAQQIDCVLLTENVSDFSRLAADLSMSGGHHRGVLIAPSGRFSPRRAGIPPLVEAIRGIARGPLDDRVVYLHPPG